MKSRILWSLAGTVALLVGTTAARAATVVEFYLEPVTSSAYTSTFTMGSTDNITTNTVSTTATSGTIYFDVYAGIAGSTNASNTGVNYAYMSFLSSGNIGTASPGSPATNFTMPSQNGLFGTSGISTTGTSQDLNSDNNLDLGSNTNTSAVGWPYWYAGASLYVAASSLTSGGYANVLLGEIAYNYTANSTGTQTATLTIKPRIQASTLTNLFFYELNGATSKADTFYGTKSTDVAVGAAPTITVSPLVNGTPVLTLNGSLANSSRIMVNATDALTFNIGNTGNLATTAWSLGTTTNIGTITPSTSSGGVIAINGTQPVSMSFSSAAAGSVSITATASDSTDGASPVSISALTVDVVSNRPLTASSTVPAAMLGGGTWYFSVSGAGNDQLYTNPTTTGGSVTPVTGVTVNSLAAGTFANGTPTQQFSLTVPQSATTLSALSAGALVGNVIKAEGLSGENVSASGTIIPGGTIVAAATASVGGAKASQATFTGTVLYGEVAAGANYTNLSSIVTGGAGNLGSVATILAGTNSSGSQVTVSMTWRTRATDELPATAQEPPMSTTGRWLASDVVQVAGIPDGEAYAMQVTYDTALLDNADATYNFNAGWMWLGSFDGTKWQNAVTGLTPGAYASVDGANHGVDESYATFWADATEHGATSVAQVVGAWGLDISTGAVWAVVNYDQATFAVVPEPGTLALLLAGALALVPVIRRRRK